MCSGERKAAAAAFAAPFESKSRLASNAASSAL
jgi:hypothetical protein